LSIVVWAWGIESRQRVLKDVAALAAARPEPVVAAAAPERYPSKSNWLTLHSL
jgi:hypothetical protein